MSTNILLQADALPEPKRETRTTSLTVERGEHLTDAARLRADDGTLYARIYATAAGNADELARRFNAYGELVEALRQLKTEATRLQNERDETWNDLPLSYDIDTLLTKYDAQP